LRKSFQPEPEVTYGRFFGNATPTDQAALREVIVELDYYAARMERIAERMSGEIKRIFAGFSGWRVSFSDPDLSGCLHKTRTGSRITNRKHANFLPISRYHPQTRTLSQSISIRYIFPQEHLRSDSFTQ